MDIYKIEKGVPHPEAPAKYGRVKKTILQLNVDESFFVPAEDCKNTQRACTLLAAMRKKDSEEVKDIMSKRQYLARAQAGGVRIWRVK